MAALDNSELSNERFTIIPNQKVLPKPTVVDTAEPFTIIGSPTPVATAAPPIPEEEPSDFGAQFLAGVTDIGTGSVQLLGLAGAGAESVYQDLFSEGPQDIGENFGRNLSSGIAGTLFDTGEAARTSVNEFFGIENPVSQSDHIARILGGFLPIPGLPAVSAVSRLGRNLRRTTNLLTQSVDTGPIGNLSRTKSFLLRGAGQEAIGFGLDDAIRAARGLPRIVIDSGEFQAIAASSPDIPIHAGLKELDEKHIKTADSDTMANFGIALAAVFGSASLAKYYARTARQGQEALGIRGATDVPDTSFNKFMRGIDPSGGPDAIFPFSEGMLSREGFEYFQELPGVLGRGLVDFSQYGGKAFVDNAQAVGNAFRHMRFSSDTIDDVLSTTHGNLDGVSKQFWSDGVYPHGYTKKDNTVLSGAQLELQVAAMTPEQVTAFERAMVSQSELVTYIENSAEGNTLLSHNLIDDPRVIAVERLVKEARLDPVVAKAMDEYGKFAKEFAHYIRYRNFGQGDDWLEKMLRRFTTKDGGLAYMPLFSNTHEDFYIKVGRRFGINLQRSGKNDLDVEVLKARADRSERTPMKAMPAMRAHVSNSIVQANKNLHNHSVLQGLTLFRTVAPHVGRAATRMGTKLRIDRTGTMQPSLRQTGPMLDESATGASYIGRGEIARNGNFENFVIDKHSVPFRKNKFTDGNAESLMKQADHFDQVRFTMADGEVHAWHVPDVGIRAALDIDPKLGGILQFLDHWKRVFTRSTTGNLSPFAIISHLFASQQVSTNTFARHGAIAGVKAPFQGVNASAIIAASDIAQDISNYATNRIVSGTGFIPKQLAIPLKNMMDRRITNRLLRHTENLHAQRREVGRSTGHQNVVQFPTTADEFARDLAPKFSKFFGVAEMQLIWNMWASLNRALHEGPAYAAELAVLGRMMRDGKAITPKARRHASNVGKDLAGDMQRLGSSGIAKFVGASVPFSAATIQSWASIWRAVKSNPKRFFAGIGALIGIPTAVELFYTAALDSITDENGEPLLFEDPSGNGRMWTFNSYRHFGFTADQQASNWILMLPWRKPWEAIIIPTSPEWAMFKGLFSDLVDGVFNLSQGNMKVNTIYQTAPQRLQLFASGVRTLGVATPPPLGAALAAMGIDVRLGLSVDESADPESPGSQFNVLRSIPFPGGERVSRNSGESQYVGDSIDSWVVRVLGELGGASATTVLRALQEFLGTTKFEGSRGAEGDIGTALSRAGEVFVNGLASQNKIFPSLLWGQKVLHFNEKSGHIASNLFVRRQALERIKKDLNSYIVPPGLKPNGRPTGTNTVIAPTDPINAIVASHVDEIRSEIKILDNEIANFRDERSRLGRSTTMGIDARQNKIDAIATNIEVLMAVQLAAITNFDKRMSGILSSQLGRDITFSTATHVPRPLN
jgi:hypothetical protein